jgi:hypothetical protein
MLVENEKYLTNPPTSTKTGVQWPTFQILENAGVANLFPSKFGNTLPRTKPLKKTD